MTAISVAAKKALSKATYEFNVVDREYSQLKYKMDSYKENIESAKYNIKKYQLIKSKKEEVKEEKQETSTDLFKNYIKEFFSILNEKYNDTNILNIKYWPYINEVINYCLENENSNYDLIDFEIIKNQYKIKNDKYDNYITLLNKEENNIEMENTSNETNNETTAVALDLDLFDVQKNSYVPQETPKKRIQKPKLLEPQKVSRAQIAQESRESTKMAIRACTFALAMFNP